MKVRFPGFYWLLAGFMALVIPLKAQVLVSGRITNRMSGKGLANTTILDLSRGYFYQSDSDGSFHLHADEGDLLVFTHLGYQPDTVMLSAPAGRVRFLDIAMQARAISLSEVVIRAMSTYQRDSIQRREAYDMVVKMPVRTLVETSAAAHPTGGFGLVLHPFGEGFMPERRLKHFKKAFFRNEIRDYIDYRFTPEEVAKVTSLHGDSLKLFMQTHRPSYRMLRQSDELELESWIHYSCQNWIRSKAKRAR